MEDMDKNRDGYVTVEEYISKLLFRKTIETANSNILFNITLAALT